MRARLPLRATAPAPIEGSFDPPPWLTHIKGLNWVSGSRCYITHSSHVHVTHAYHAYMYVTCMHVHVMEDISKLITGSSKAQLYSSDCIDLHGLPLQTGGGSFLEEISISLSYQHSVPQLGVRKASWSKTQHSGILPTDDCCHQPQWLGCHLDAMM